MDTSPGKLLTSPAEVEDGLKRLGDVLAQAQDVTLMLCKGSGKYYFQVQWRESSKKGEYRYMSLAFSMRELSCGIAKVSEAVARSSTSVDSLELACQCCDGPENPEFFEIGLKQFGIAGHWEKSLKTLYLVNWKCAIDSSFAPADLRTLPANLSTLDFTCRHRDANVRPCTTMVNSFAKKLPALGSLHVSTPNSRGHWILSTVLTNLGEACPRLSEVFIYEGQNDGLIMTDVEIQSILATISRFRFLETFYCGGSRLQENAVDSILANILMLPRIRSIDLHGCRPGPDGIAAIVKYLSKPKQDVYLQFIGVQLDGQLSIEDKLWFETAADKMVVGYEEDRLPVQEPAQVQAEQLGGLVLTRRVRRRTETLLTLINRSLRINSLQKFVHDSNVCRALVPLVLAKCNQPKHRTRLFTMIKSLAGTLFHDTDTASEGSEAKIERTSSQACKNLQ